MDGTRIARVFRELHGTIAAGGAVMCTAFEVRRFEPLAMMLFAYLVPIIPAGLALRLAR